MTKSGSLFIFLFALLTTVFHVQSSSPPFNFNLNITTTNSSSSLPFNNITIGSSIYTSSSSSNQTSNSSYWLSPSGVFAFGFYPLCYNCDQYNVAIWINRPSNKVVVWSNNNEPIYSGSSIQLSHDGVFTIHQLAADSTTTTKPLFNHTLGPATYALMQDTGNFVVYNSDSNIVWQSFDYPSDTILQGQTLKPDDRLVVQITGQKLIMQKYGNLELIEKVQHRHCTGNTIIMQKYGPKFIGKCRYYLSEDITWQSKTRKEGGGIVLNLDSTGHMYLVDKAGIVIKNLTKVKKQNKASNGSLETTIHRATLESDGVFRLYAETIGPPTHDSENSVLLWELYCKKCDRRKQMLFKAKLIGWLASAVAVFIVLVCLYGWVIMPKCSGDDAC
ncbi:G-type lectin S-receptor-like serine/threonine-protein kinase LECRK1 [Thalictrum thalictroides]|uniref:G-type lectin S-receptor-like serine/threonine-protein kinase LECRK1 n=1 Tax=Thalictrum thalictroides TaxID=46969 RepID=A0A7J6WW51_THATH|nr:G-type lectin S-receptor-like serine/threonine-protein kinase LECRK1 [Thalictrum thalictroides]